MPPWKCLPMWLNSYMLPVNRSKKQVRISIDSIQEVFRINVRFLWEYFSKLFQCNQRGKRNVIAILHEKKFLETMQEGNTVFFLVILWRCFCNARLLEKGSFLQNLLNRREFVSWECAQLNPCVAEEFLISVKGDDWCSKPQKENYIKSLSQPVLSLPRASPA